MTLCTMQVSIDKHMAKAMEERLLKGIEGEMLRDKQAVIRSFMKDGSAGTHTQLTHARRVTCCLLLHGQLAANLSHSTCSQAVTVNGGVVVILYGKYEHVVSFFMIRYIICKFYMFIYV